MRPPALRLRMAGSLAEVAGTFRDTVSGEDRQRFKVGQGWLVPRVWRRLRYLRFRLNDKRRFYFALPALSPVSNVAGDEPSLTEDGSRSDRYVLLDVGREWVSNVR